MSSRARRYHHEGVGPSGIAQHGHLRGCMRFFLILFLALCPLLAHAADLAVFDERTRVLPLGEHMAVFEDVRGDKTIDDVTSSALQGSFRPHDKAVLNAGYSRSAFWLRIDLQYRPRGMASGNPQSWLLELAYPPLDHLELYEEGGDGRFHLSHRTGDALPFSSREIRQNNYLFTLDFQPEQVRRVYLRLQSQGSIQAPLSLWSPAAYLSLIHI